MQRKPPEDKKHLNKPKSDSSRDNHMTNGQNKPLSKYQKCYQANPDQTVADFLVALNLSDKVKPSQFAQLHKITCTELLLGKPIDLLPQMLGIKD